MFETSWFFYVWVSVIGIAAIAVGFIATKNAKTMPISSFVCITLFVFMIVLVYHVTDEKSKRDSLGISVEFSSLAESHLLKYESYSEDLKVGIISDQQGKGKGIRRLVKNIPSDIKPGDLFIIWGKKALVYKAKQLSPS